jgi:hypothetical protein
MKMSLRQLFATLRCAFSFDVANDPAVERAARRYYGLAFLALGTVLTTWMWTLDSASYAIALDDLLERGIAPVAAELAHARGWALAFYAADTLLFIGCYVGFSVVVARLIHARLWADLAAEPDALPHGLVAWIARRLLPGTKLLLWALVVGDAFENVTAMILLFYGEPVAGLAKAFVYSAGIKTACGGALAIWLIGAAFTWLLSGSIPVGAFPALHALRKERHAMRVGVFDVLARTRYCLLIVVAYAVLMLGIDQAQDVLAGLASFLHADLATAATLVAALALGLFALHTHAHSIWVWVRLLVRLRRSDGDQGESVSGETFSMWWGRLLGAAPWFIVAVLCVRTAGQAHQVDDAATGWMMLGAGAFASAWGALFVLIKESESHEPHRSNRRYYNADSDEIAVLTDDAYRFLKVIKRSPVWIPLVAVAGILLIRWLYVFFPTNTACNALAAISFSFALWTCVINRVALNSLRSRIPWVLALVVLIASFAGVGLTQNHGVLAGANLAATGAGAASLESMFWHSVLLAVGAIAAYLLWTRRLLAKRPAPGTNGATAAADRRQLTYSWGAVALWSVFVLFLGSHGQKQADAPPESVPVRPTLQQAVHDWLRDRLNDCAVRECAQIPVYLVSAEGGGIRAAYYSAQLLSHLSQVEKLELPRRVFSLSGVSGGSLGVTSWRLCLGAADAPACVAPLGGVDLLTPLTSAWMFEDALALVVPTRPCDLPGCGFLDRASWFERSLEKSMTAFSRPPPGTPPYLFLNSTWVETGERAIASTIEIESRECVKLRQAAIERGKYEEGWSKTCAPKFPTARDQWYEIGHNARSSTLAHNSARFPYFNPIGYVRDWGHVADGGYFDNSGTQTTAEILDEFARQLTCGGAGCRRLWAGTGEHPPLSKTPRTTLSADDYLELGKRVAVTAIMIRNGVRISTDPADSSCAAPRARKPQSLFANAAGPLVTALNATGIGTPHRVAQCNLQRALSRLSVTLPNQATGGGYVDVRLVSESQLYPLGWYLSAAAQRGIEQAARDCVNAQGLAAELQRAAANQEMSAARPCFERVPSGVPPPASEGRNE